MPGKRIGTDTIKRQHAHVLAVESLGHGRRLQSVSAFARALVRLPEAMLVEEEFKALGVPFAERGARMDEYIAERPVLQ
jgi:hypothetical protein